jgi:predicted YcjX-like family ATPase
MPEVEFKEKEQIVENLCHNQYNNEILRFFARHPYARFDKQVLIVGIGLSDVRRIEQALEDMVRQKILDTTIGQGAPFYWLVKREPTHSAVISALAPRIHKSGEAFSHLPMIQRVMPLNPCHSMATSSK